jgi:hypothetical protein
MEWSSVRQKGVVNMSETPSALVDAPVVADQSPLDANDRCDSCGAQAYVRVSIASGQLLFCGHHAAKYKDQLLDQATAWHDETFRLAPASEPSLD